jgi:hypothetical protein
MMTYKQYLNEYNMRPHMQGPYMDNLPELSPLNHPPEVVKKNILAHGNPVNILNYVINWMHGERWPEGEEVIKKNPYYAYQYAEQVVRGRWPEGEDAIKKDPTMIYWYAKQILKHRWLEAEPFIPKDHPDWKNYQRYFGEIEAYGTDEGKWNTIRAKKLSKTVLGKLNKAGMTKDMQEYIVQHRPDLINQIKDLDPELKIRYSHEVELGNVDL